MQQQSRIRIIDEKKISAILDEPATEDPGRVRAILEKALELKGLSIKEVGILCVVRDPDLLVELYHTARRVKEKIYGRRVVLFAPLYVSNMCANECSYCAFRASSEAIHRRALAQREIARETAFLVDQGHKRILLIAGESYPKEGIHYVIKCIDTIYSIKRGPEKIRRVNVNVAPLSVEEFRQLKAAKIGTYQLFQETYHYDTYHKVHLRGRKRDYEWRITAMDRAMEAEIEDVGIGVLFGLYDWRFEILALIQHVSHLEEMFGVGCHTVSVPRIEPALNAPLSERPPAPVSDEEFRKLISILRLAIPYTGMIMSTRETPEMRYETFSLGISQISAGSRTNPGGYTEDAFDASQFSLGDYRTLDQVVRDIARAGYIPSFCTGCYRKGRIGADFMALAKPGLMKNYCDLNAISTFVEYVENYASSETKMVAEKAIETVLESMPNQRRGRAFGLVSRVRSGERDVFV